MAQTKQGVRVDRRPGWISLDKGEPDELRRVWATSQTRAGVASTI